MNALITALLALAPMICSSQQQVNGNDQPHSFEIGITSSYVLSTPSYPKQYRLAGYDDSSDKNLNTSLLFQASGRFHINQFYLSASLGLGTMHINEESTSTENDGNADVGGYSSTTRNRYLFINESRVSFAGSLEAGMFFLKPSSRFNIGSGIGADFVTTLNTEVERNELVIHSKTTSVSNAPGGPYTTTYTSDNTYTPEDNEWGNNVRPHGTGIVLPKISILAKYAITNQLSIHLAPQARFSFLNNTVEGNKLAIDFPISLGIYYRF